MCPGLSWKGVGINEQPRFCFQSCNAKTCSIYFHLSLPGAGPCFISLGNALEAKILKIRTSVSSESQARAVSYTGQIQSENFGCSEHMASLCCVLVCKTGLGIAQIVCSAGNNWGQLLSESELLDSDGSSILKTATQRDPLLFLQFSPGNQLREGKGMWVNLSPLISWLIQN